MPATRNQIRRARIIGHPVDFGDGVEVTFWYDRNKITDGWAKDWEEHERQTNTPALNGMLADLIDRWDLFEDEGGPVIPITADSIGELFSLPDKIMLMRELMTAGVPSSEEGNGSSGPSSTPSTTSTEPQQTHQNGPAPSPSPELSASPSST